MIFNTIKMGLIEVNEHPDKPASSSLRLAKVLIALALFSIGGAIYIGYRTDVLQMFRWLDAVGLSYQINTLRDTINQDGLYEWVKYSLPDGLWLFAYMLIIDSIWNGCNQIPFHVFLLGLPFFALISEVLQYYSLFPGVFDIWDLVCYTFAIILYYIISKNKIPFIYEAKNFLFNFGSSCFCNRRRRL